MRKSTKTPLPSAKLLWIYGYRLLTTTRKDRQVQIFIFIKHSTYKSWKTFRQCNNCYASEAQQMLAFLKII